MARRGRSELARLSRWRGRYPRPGRAALRLWGWVWDCDDGEFADAREAGRVAGVERRPVADCDRGERGVEDRVEVGAQCEYNGTVVVVVGSGGSVVVDSAAAVVDDRGESASADASLSSPEQAPSASVTRTASAVERPNRPVTGRSVSSERGDGNGRRLLHTTRDASVPGLELERGRRVSATKPEGRTARLINTSTTLVTRP